MSNPDRLSGLDASFLHIEGAVAHMHVAACAILEGPAPTYPELLETISKRLHLIPRYRQRLAFVPYAQGRPVWVDDPRFRLPFHVRHTALPKPGSDAQLRRLAGRIFSQALDRSRPLWEVWLVEGLSDGRFALLTKTHHALVDGVSGVEIASVLFDPSKDPAPIAPPQDPWVPRPLPSGPQLLADALVERTTAPEELSRNLRRVLRTPRRAFGAVGGRLVNAGALAWAGIDAAPKSPYNLPIGPHRRFAWVHADLEQFKQIKNRLGGTINDAILASVAGALGSHMRRQGHITDGVVLKTLVPVSVKPEPGHEALAAAWAPLPVGVTDPVARVAEISSAMSGVKDREHALGAEEIKDLAGFAPPTLVAQAARLQARHRLYNLMITNAPGPQFPLYMRGRRLLAIYPLVPLAQHTALAVAVMSYDGALNFGLNADYDALPDVEELGNDLRAAIAELLDAANRVSLPNG